ncbi:MAG TPA: energy transducer TonB [Oligoflexia bacterium]|nr:energy transducer TonB [Oligoflexia bacterium]HMP47773.1 energy transducer TonB [Oligoflexia bacterium]
MDLVLDKSLSIKRKSTYLESLIFLSVSIAIHLFLLSGFFLKLIGPGVLINNQEKPVELVIKLEKELSAVKPQDPDTSKIQTFPDSKIVSPSDIEESSIIPDTSRLSDKNTKVKEEAIKRGVDIAKAPKPLKKTETQQKIHSLNTNSSLDTSSSSSIISSKTSLKNLFLDKNLPIIKPPDQNISGSGESNPAPDVIDNSTASSEARLQSFIGIPGRSDYLPNVADGDITLLNAKADRFAVFVRRVALQVFSSLRTSNWADQLEFQKSMTVGDVTIIAELDPKGNLLSANVVEGSGIEAFDRAILASVKKGAWDKNPPAAALAKNGNIRFIFKSRAQIRRIDQGRFSRWILLATGLE